MQNVTLVPPAILDIDVSVPKTPFDVTCHSWSGEEVYLPRLPLRQVVTMTVRAHAGRYFRDNLGARIDISVRMPTALFRFQGLVKSVDIMDTWKVTLEAIGQVLAVPTNEPHPNCRSTFTPTKEKRMSRCITTAKTGIEIPKGKELKDRQFYVGSKQIFPGGNNEDWANGTIEDALAHAQKMVEETGEDQFVAKIIRVVRKRPTPVDVEKV